MVENYWKFDDFMNLCGFLQQILNLNVLVSFLGCAIGIYLNFWRIFVQNFALTLSTSFQIRLNLTKMLKNSIKNCSWEHFSAIFLNFYTFDQFLSIDDYFVDLLNHFGYFFTCYWLFKATATKNILKSTFPWNFPSKFFIFYTIQSKNSLIKTIKNLHQTENYNYQQIVSL